IFEIDRGRWGGLGLRSARLLLAGAWSRLQGSRLRGPRGGGADGERHDPSQDERREGRPGPDQVGRRPARLPRVGALAVLNVAADGFELAPIANHDRGVAAAARSGAVALRASWLDRRLVRDHDGALLLRQM